jgi:tetratricopeptide (TPR) repeat protein
MNRTLKSALFGSLIALAASPAIAAQADVFEADDFLRQAEDAERRGDDRSAEQYYQSAIIYAPATIAPYLGIAEFYSDGDELDLAKKYFDIALWLDPANPPAHKGLALLSLAQGDIADAEFHHEILVEACAPACPEAAEVRDAISANASSAMVVD